MGATERASMGWGFWLGWVLASAIGLGIGLVVYLPLAVALGDDLTIAGRIIVSGIGGAFLGAVLGVAQWALLRRRLARPGSWIWASIAGGAIGGPAGRLGGDLVSDATDFVTALVLGGAVLGACIGVLQWFVLRHETRSAGWWVLASAFGLALGLGLGRLGGAALYDAVASGVGETAARVLATTIFGTLIVGGYGAITGTVLIRLIGRKSGVPRDVVEASAV